MEVFPVERKFFVPTLPNAANRIVCIVGFSLLLQVIYLVVQITLKMTVGLNCSYLMKWI